MEIYTKYGYCSTATLRASDIYKGKLYDFFAKLTPKLRLLHYSLLDVSLLLFDRFLAQRLAFLPRNPKTNIQKEESIRGTE